jgi:hypothetical protein
MFTTFVDFGLTISPWLHFSHRSNRSNIAQWPPRTYCTYGYRVIKMFVFFCQVAIRVYFPDRTVLQGFFSPKETGKQMYWTKESLTKSNMGNKLFHTIKICHVFQFQQLPRSSMKTLNKKTQTFIYVSEGIHVVNSIFEWHWVWGSWAGCSICCSEYFGFSKQ